MNPLGNPFLTDNTSFINSYGVAFVMVMGLLVLVLPRRFALFPILAMVCYMTMGTRFLVGGLNFPMIRVLMIFCWIRLIVRGEWKHIAMNEIDKAVVWFTVVSIITHTLLLGSEGFKYKLGQGYDALGFYFFFRYLIRDWDDVVRMAKVTAILLVPLALEMLNEKLTLVNHFAVLGGVSPNVIVREGTARAQGPFGHPILAGTFGATLMPFMVALWSQRRARFLAVVGMIAATAITGLAGSSGPLFAYVIGIVTLAAWPLRGRMRTVRWGILLTLVALHLTMKAPVWFLLARVSVFDASTGYHRAYLIDRCIANFRDWWLFGSTSYWNWGYYLFDRTNHYVCLATDGGLPTLMLFMVILTRCYRGVGRVVREMQERGAHQGSWFAWALGISLVVHCVSFVSITYFDQNIVNWYLLLAMIASACGMWLDSKSTVKADEALTAHGALPASVSARRADVGGFVWRRPGAAQTATSWRAPRRNPSRGAGNVWQA